MPGRSVPEAIEGFLRPLREAVGCLGTAHITLTPGARGQVGEPHAWALNGGGGMALAQGLSLSAQMHFEVVDRGKSRGDERFKVSTRAYLYAVRDSDGSEILAAHWHPTGSSPVTFPHWHLGSAALSETGVFLARAHIPSPRVTLEWVVREALESMGAEPTCDDWRDRLARTEELFEQHKSWGG